MLNRRQEAILEILRGAAKESRCQIGMRSLARQVDCSVNTLRSEIKKMVRDSLIVLEPGSYRTTFRLIDPREIDQAAELRRLRLQIANAPYAGEAVLKAVLSVIVDESAYMDNARPSFLVNPLTQQLLEYDHSAEGRHRVSWPPALWSDGTLPV